MIRILSMLCAALLWTSAWAQTAQQERMKSCNAQAAKKDLKGDERKAFMSKCLKADSGDLTAQQERMVSCNAQANRRELKGDQRREFMGECLRGDSAAAGGRK